MPAGSRGNYLLDELARVVACGRGWDDGNTTERLGALEGSRADASVGATECMATLVLGRTLTFSIGYVWMYLPGRRVRRACAATLVNCSSTHTKLPPPPPPQSSSSSYLLLSSSSRRAVDGCYLGVVPAVGAGVDGAADLPVLVVVQVVLRHRVGVAVDQPRILLVVRRQVVLLKQNNVPKAFSILQIPDSMRSAFLGFVRAVVVRRRR
jgi:hypothetical protein